VISPGLHHPDPPDLVNWTNVFTNNSPVRRHLVDTNAASLPTQFYRIILGLAQVRNGGTAARSKHSNPMMSRVTGDARRRRAQLGGIHRLRLVRPVRRGIFTTPRLHRLSAVLQPRSCLPSCRNAASTGIIGPQIQRALEMLRLHGIVRHHHAQFLQRCVPSHRAPRTRFLLRIVMSSSSRSAAELFPVVERTMSLEIAMSPPRPSASHDLQRAPAAWPIQQQPVRLRITEISTKKCSWVLLMLLLMHPFIGPVQRPAARWNVVFGNFTPDDHFRNQKFTCSSKLFSSNDSGSRKLQLRSMRRWREVLGIMTPEQEYYYANDSEALSERDHADQGTLHRPAWAGLHPRSRSA